MMPTDELDLMNTPARSAACSNLGVRHSRPACTLCSTAAEAAGIVTFDATASRRTPPGLVGDHFSTGDDHQ